jgi:CSLREA domain-containing protein
LIYFRNTSIILDNSATIVGYPIPNGLFDRAGYQGRASLFDITQRRLHQESDMTNTRSQIVLVIILAVFMASAANGATYVVTKVADTNDGVCNEDCSLREAIAAANATPEDDIIVFSSLFDTPQTIVLSGSEMVIANNGSLTINGPGAHLLTLDGNQTSRILSSGADVIVSIDGIRFTRGNGAGALNTGRGGAIYNVGGTMVLSNSIITQNTAGNGGGLNNAATTNPSVPADLTIINCVISNNSTTSAGGAMQNFSTSTFRMYNSTVSGNTSATGGGGAMQANGMVMIVNSTFFGNTSNGTTGGGAITSNGSLFNVTNSTFAGNTAATNGGGIHRGTTNVNGYIRNTIIAGNTGPQPDVSNSAGGIQSQGNNIIGAVGTSTGWIKSDLLNTNPLLGPLSDNGGFGMTLLPLEGSPAIDAGQNCVVDSSCSSNNPPIDVSTDQRGVVRPANGIVDIGSVEVSVLAEASVSGTVVTPSGRQVNGAIVTISGLGDEGETFFRTMTTNSFGHFSFGGVPTGESYQLNVHAKSLTFNPTNIEVNVDISGLVLIANQDNFGDSKERE